MLMRPLLPWTLTVSVYIFLRGHNLPGGGFVAGLITSVALVMQYLANGIALRAAAPATKFGRLAVAGLLLAAGIGMASWLFGRPFLTSAHGHVSLPLIGEFELASAMVFDLGVYVVVVTVVVTVLSGLGRLSLRARQGRRADGSAAGDCHRGADRLRRLPHPARAHFPGPARPDPALLRGEPVSLCQRPPAHRRTAADSRRRQLCRPLPQALVLTAIVIGFGMTAYLAMLALRALSESGRSRRRPKGTMNARADPADPDPLCRRPAADGLGSPVPARSRGAGHGPAGAGHRPG
jgi:multisubunit Na+/H+ antiporter MnhB subunit